MVGFGGCDGRGCVLYFAAGIGRVVNGSPCRAVLSGCVWVSCWHVMCGELGGDVSVSGEVLSVGLLVSVVCAVVACVWSVHCGSPGRYGAGAMFGSGEGVDGVQGWSVVLLGCGPGFRGWLSLELWVVAGASGGVR